MFSFALIPKYLKEVFSHIPTVAFKTVSWSDLWSESKEVFKSYNSQEVDEALFDFLKDKLQEELEAPQNEVTPHYVCPEFALKVYFLQLKNPHGIFLDLRPTRFRSLPNDSAHFVPSFLIYKFKDEFRLNLLELYKAFYRGDDKTFRDSLTKLKLTTGLNEAKKEELAKMFYSHFGGENLSETHFNMESFHDSFLKIFKFFMENKIKLSSDFIFLGIYLITLYMHLDKTGPQDVKAIFNDVI